MKNIFLSRTLLFSGISDEEIGIMLSCFGAYEKTYVKGEYVLHSGDTTESLGLVISGSIIIENDDVWGNKSILSNITQGEIFAETYAFIPGEPLLINVIAAEKTTVLFLKISKLIQTCSNSCAYHHKLIKNLLQISARKNLNLSRRILHTSSKSIRGRLLSFFSEKAMQNGGKRFTVPYNRQQLADYLGVDRSAMSNELSKMQKDGIITYNKNSFELRDISFLF